MSLVLGDLVVGMSYGWWQHKHTRYHANPNKIGADPDIELPVIAVATIPLRGSADWASVGDRWVAALAWCARSLALFCVGWGSIIAGMNALTQPPTAAA